MPGHMTEKSWNFVSDEANRKLEEMVRWIVECDALYMELLELWTYHGGVAQNVADQLFGGVNGGAPANAAQVTMTTDLKDALTAAHNLMHGSAQDNVANLSEIRKFT